MYDTGTALATILAFNIMDKYVK